MPTRYQQLRQAVARLSAPAEEQARYLDETFTSLTGCGSAAGCGNDELALELEGIFLAAADMIEYGELTQEEREAIQPIDLLLNQWSGQEHAHFWRREALFCDPRWAEIRVCAARSLAKLPNEERANGRSS